MPIDDIGTGESDPRQPGTPGITPTRQKNRPFSKIAFAILVAIGTAVVIALIVTQT